MAAAIDLEEMFRPPINRAMKVLDRSFFQKTVPISVAKVLDKTQIPNYRARLGQDILKLDRMQAMRSIPEPEGGVAKALLLQPSIKFNDPATWSPALRDFVELSKLSVMPYDLTVDYDYWNYQDEIISSILPENLMNELPSGFTIVGHIAHLNLREQYLPYRKLIADILLDKNPTIRTVINKVDEVGEHSEFRTFSFELLAGEPDLNVTIHEHNCTFAFDYSKVYWNSRLESEHRRLIDKFERGQAICDVMAGVGPFAVPAGKKQCFVWANDLNPESYASLNTAIVKNKVSNFVRPFNQDGQTFVQNATETLMNSNITADVTPKQSRNAKQVQSESPSPEYLTCPKVFSHYVLNLPATALTFLPAFVGLFSGCSDVFEPTGSEGLPTIHVHCFSTKSDDNKEEARKICEEISIQLQHPMRPGNLETDGGVEIWDVRDVAPLKRMFCASFKLPQAVAFR